VHRQPPLHNLQYRQRRSHVTAGDAPAAAPSPPRPRGAPAQRGEPGARVLGLARATNAAIMLAAFGDVPHGAAGLRRALLTGAPPLGADRLALLLQVPAAARPRPPLSCGPSVLVLRALGSSP